MSEGRKDDDMKPRMDLIPPEAVVALATTLGFGAKKYADRNWEKGIKFGRVFAAIMRHLWAWWRGENLDPESGLPHTWHALTGVAFLVAFGARGRTDLDDRPIAADRVNEIKIAREMGKDVAFLEVKI